MKNQIKMMFNNKTELLILDQEPKKEVKLLNNNLPLKPRLMLNTPLENKMERELNPKKKDKNKKEFQLNHIH